MNEVDYLIISSSIDYSTDLICYELYERKVRYIRLNRDHFSKYKILYNLQNATMTIYMDDDLYVVSNRTLKGIYFRAPVFLRSHKKYDLHEQLYRSQWSSFIRNLIVFGKAKWINHPVSTYKAENKLYQLKCAKEIELHVPQTYIGNVVPEYISLTNNYVVKPLDTALFYTDTQELFTYSTMVNGQDLLDENINDAPIILQEYLENKLDLRVTVIGSKIYPVSITNNGQHIVGDWRKNPKKTLQYTETFLPQNVKDKILELMDKLKLVFGGIDLIISNNKYYFIEVNPTGEWGWLSSGCNIPIEKAIVEELLAV